jgi:hypothetical protein
MVSIFEKLAAWLRPEDVRARIVECRDALRAEGFLPEADDLNGLLALGGDRYDVEPAVARIARAVRDAVGARASSPLLAKLDRLVAAVPPSAAAPLGAAERREGFRDELLRIDPILREHGYPEAAAAAYRVAGLLKGSGEPTDDAFLELARALDGALHSTALPGPLREKLSELRRWAAEPRRYFER